MRKPWLRVAILVLLLAGLVAAPSVLPRLSHFIGSRLARLDNQQVRPEGPFDRAPLLASLKASGFALGQPAFVRIFKREARLELWMRDGERFRPFRSYPVCRYSGELGPKLKEGDGQAPEGFYKVALKQLNPNSRHHLSFNLGFPNAFDRQLGRTGSALMVHGGCTSVGCYAMTDAQVDEIYAVVEAAMLAGQREVDVHVFPFRPERAVLDAEAGHAAAPFWRNLAEGFSLFETTGLPPKIGACRGLYRFDKDAEAPGCEPITGWV